MTVVDLEQLYEQQIKPLPRAARLQLLAKIAQELAYGETQSGEEGQLSALDILAEAPGQRLFKTVAEVEAYIDEERNSWE